MSDSYARVGTCVFCADEGSWRWDFTNDPIVPRSARYCKTHMRGRLSRTEDSIEENTSCLSKRALTSTMTLAVTFFVIILRSSCDFPTVALVIPSFSHQSETSMGLGIVLVL